MKTLHLVFLAAALMVSVCHADLIIDDEKITDIRLGPWNTDSFAVKTTGTNDACSGQWVIFNRNNLVSAESYDRAYTMALAAMSADKFILVDSGNGTDCGGANTIGFVP